MNIYQKLIEVRKVVPYLQKENAGTQYKYVSSSQVLSNCKMKMDELGLLLVPSVTGHKVSESVIEYQDDKNHVTKRTITYFTELDMIMTWVNAEDPKETISCPWYGQGVDIAGEKGVGKAMTYAEKYFMLKFFNIPTDKDDPDSFQKKIDGDDPPKGAQKPQKQPDKQPPASSKPASQKPTDAPTKVNFAGFWAETKKLGFTREQVHQFAGVESISDWTKPQVDMLYKQLKKVKEEEAKSA